MKQIMYSENPSPAFLQTALCNNAGVDVPYPEADDWALFLDIDGTISDFAPKPEEARIPPGLLEMLSNLRSGAVALVTGRSIASADSMTQPYRFNIAGQHGLEIRGSDGKIILAPGINYVFLSEIMQKVEYMAARHDGLHVEHKSASIAVHYRLAPEKGPMVLHHLHELIARYGNGFRLQQGKMVVEVRPCGADKGTAIAFFMQYAPFAEKVPLFVGDDETDEEGFRAVNALGGISIKVGEGKSLATHRIAHPPDVRDWLTAILPLLNKKQERIKK